MFSLYLFDSEIGQEWQGVIKTQILAQCFNATVKTGDVDIHKMQLSHRDMKGE